MADVKITIKEVEFLKLLGLLQTIRSKTLELSKCKHVVNQVDQWSIISPIVTEMSKNPGTVWLVTQSYGKKKLTMEKDPILLKSIRRNDISPVASAWEREQKRGFSNCVCLKENLPRFRPQSNRRQVAALVPAVPHVQSLWKFLRWHNTTEWSFQLPWRCRTQMRSSQVRLFDLCSRYHRTKTCHTWHHARQGRYQGLSTIGTSTEHDLLASSAVSSILPLTTAISTSTLPLRSLLWWYLWEIVCLSSGPETLIMSLNTSRRTCLTQQHWARPQMK